MHLHILGICGTFMGGLAALAHAAGHTVTGCDQGVYPPMSDQLRALGIHLIEGYGADQLALKPDLYVIGNVVSRARLPDGSAKYPLMDVIMDAGAPYTSGPQWLAEHVLHGRHVLAVAGTHGKTTTTSMLAWVLDQVGLQPGFLIGGVPLDFGVSARLGHVGPNAPFVIEADEYDTAFFDKRSKFLHYRPRTAVLNNLEFDHADIFADLAQIERSFHYLVRTVPPSGRVVVNDLAESLTRVLAMGCWSERRGFGTVASDFQAAGAADDFDVLHHGRVAGHVRWELSGVHNQLNALAAVAAAEHVGVAPDVACAALSRFRSVRRRMERVGEAACAGGAPIVVYDDFAHHPTAIRTTVDGLRAHLDATGAKAQRIIAVFEPRSNTMKLGTMKSQLPWALEHADQSYCYAGQLDWDAAAALAPLAGHAHVLHELDAIVRAVAADARPGDQVLCMSNGSFSDVQHRLLKALQAR